MNQPPEFVFDENANSPDLTDAEVLGAIPTTHSEDIVPHLKEQVCSECGKPLMVTDHEKRFRFPHFYWRSRLVCDAGHKDTRIFQVTWLYESTHMPR